MQERRVMSDDVDLRWMQAHNEITAAYKNESDRAAALLAVAFLDDQLKQVLQTVLVDDAKVQKRLFGVYGPLGTFSARADMAYALGYLSRSVYGDLEVIRRSRNNFAHAASVIDFSTAEIKQQCANLACALWLFEDKSADVPSRDRFLMAVSHCVGEIRFGMAYVRRPTVPPDRADTHPAM